MRTNNPLCLDPNSWPYGTLLPVTRIGGDGFWNDSDLGIVTHEGGVIIPTVYIGNMLDLKHADLNEVERETFESVDQLFEVWRPD